VFPERIEPETKFLELRDAVERLPEKLRLPFLLVYMEGYSLQEAASVIGITLFALKSRLKRAKKNLQIELREEGDS
jgi:RNA polymerase sigma-70 factor (ECF subfamily)